MLDGSDLQGSHLYFCGGSFPNFLPRGGMKPAEFDICVAAGNGIYVYIWPPIPWLHQGLLEGQLQTKVTAVLLRSELHRDL